MGPKTVHSSVSIKQIVDDQLCVQCGICVPICPTHAIEMRETPAGLLVAFVQEATCDGCGQCRLVCPGAGFTLPDLEGADPFKGNVIQAYVGHAREDAIRLSGQSGGVVSALLLYLLESKQIDAALVSMMPADGSLRPRPVLTRTREEILAAQSSKYCPVAPGTLLNQIREGERVAMVGLPCQMHGILNLSKHGKSIATGIKYRIGLFCDRTQHYSMINYMVQQARLKKKDVVGLEYRSKSRSGWPGEVCFHLFSGEKRYFPQPFLISLKDYFTPVCCRLCFDKMNVFCDFAVGDPWRISHSVEGESVVLTRNQKVDLLLKKAAAKNYLDVKTIDAEMIFNSQDIENRRRNFSSFTRLHDKMGFSLPEYRGLSSEFLCVEDTDLDRRNQQRLIYSQAMAECISSKNTLALVRSWMRKKKRRVFFVSFVWKFKKLVKLIFYLRKN